MKEWTRGRLVESGYETLLSFMYSGLAGST